ncbi:MAG: TIGR03936 family radical SAM-associated protein [Lachnospiraceae bacterium]|nr:TIGR03936 family radical SAM-associated protein [Lachnospiraceae bacterium]
MKIRVRFTKSGAMKFTGHLDVMHFFQQLLRRSNIPIAYSTGMSPHQIMSFALPLGVGYESVGEYMDIETTSAVSSSAALEQMNKASVEGIEILSYRELPQGAKNAMSSVAAADYLVGFREGKAPSFNVKQALEDLFEKPEIIVTKKTKKSERTLDIKPLIYEHHTETLTDPCSVFLKLSCGSVDNIKPELVMEAMYSMMNEEPSEHAFTIKRLDMYTVISSSDKGALTVSSEGMGGDGVMPDFISLDSIGRDIE